MIAFYLTTVGRISRKATWLAVILPLIALTTLIVGIETALTPSPLFKFLGIEYSPVTFGFFILLLWPSIAFSIRRFHDVNMTGWWAATFVPASIYTSDVSGFAQSSIVERVLIIIWGISLVASFIFGLALLFVPGTRGSNRFGHDPLSKQKA